MLTYVAACGGGGGDTITQNAQIVQTTAPSTDTDTETSSQPAFSTSSSIDEPGQIYVLERFSLGPEKNAYPHWAAKPMTHRSHWIMW